MKVHHVTISEVKDLIEKLELKITNKMNREINVRVKDEVDREVNRRLREDFIL